MIRPPLSNKCLGELAEILFLAVVIRLGYIACKPWGDTAPFDWVVVGAGPRFKRIQVKATFVRNQGRYFINLVGPGDAAYSPKDVDLVAAYAALEDAWYIIPVRVLAGRKMIAVSPDRPGKDRLWGRYRDNWWRLGQANPQKTYRRRRRVNAEGPGADGR